MSMPHLQLNIPPTMNTQCWFNETHTALATRNLTHLEYCFRKHLSRTPRYRASRVHTRPARHGITNACLQAMFVLTPCDVEGAHALGRHVYAFGLRMYMHARECLRSDWKRMQITQRQMWQEERRNGSRSCALALPHSSGISIQTDTHAPNQRFMTMCRCIHTAHAHAHKR
jgi:hypothetical protein